MVRILIAPSFDSAAWAHGRNSIGQNNNYLKVGYCFDANNHIEWNYAADIVAGAGVGRTAVATRVAAQGHTTANYIDSDGIGGYSGIIAINFLSSERRRWALALWQAMFSLAFYSCHSCLWPFWYRHIGYR